MGGSSVLPTVGATFVGGLIVAIVGSVRSLAAAAMLWMAWSEENVVFQIMMHGLHCITLKIGSGLIYIRAMFPIMGKTGSNCFVLFSLNSKQRIVVSCDLEHRQRKRQCSTGGRGCFITAPIPYVTTTRAWFFRVIRMHLHLRSWRRMGLAGCQILQKIGTWLPWHRKTTADQMSVSP